LSDVRFVKKAVGGRGAEGAEGVGCGLERRLCPLPRKFHG